MSADNLNWQEYDENETMKALRNNAKKTLDLFTVNQLRCACQSVTDEFLMELQELLKDNKRALELLDAVDHLQFIHHCGDTVSLSELNDAKDMIVNFYSPRKTKRKKQMTANSSGRKPEQTNRQK